MFLICFFLWESFRLFIRWANVTSCDLAFPDFVPQERCMTSRLISFGYLFSLDKAGLTLSHFIWTRIAARRNYAVSFDNAFAREVPRQKQRRYGGCSSELSGRLVLHDGYSAKRLDGSEVEVEAQHACSIQEQCDRAVQRNLYLCLLEPVVEVLEEKEPAPPTFLPARRGF